MEPSSHGVSRDRRPGVGRALVMGLLLAAALVAVGCGKKSPPLPPALPMPPGVTDLGKALQGGTLTLSWSQPKGSGIDLSHVEGFYVYRSLVKLPAPDCQGCPLTFTKAAEVPFDGGPMSYYETLRKGYRYTYKVTPYSPGGRPGADSNLVTLDY